MKSALAWTLLATLMGSAGVAEATTGGLYDPPTRVVRYGDLDLSRNEGAAVLYTRIRAAARQVCQPLAQVASPSIILLNQCISHAIAHAVGDVDAPLLTDYYRMTSMSRQR
ncbi:MAG TPA: UrcA family protein [Steroidobacteraceae bacterium]